SGNNGNNGPGSGNNGNNGPGSGNNGNNGPGGGNNGNNGPGGGNNGNNGPGGGNNGNNGPGGGNNGPGGGNNGPGGGNNGPGSGNNGAAPGGNNGAAPGGNNGAAPGGNNGAAPGGNNGAAPGGNNGAAPGQSGVNNGATPTQSGTIPGVTTTVPTTTSVPSIALSPGSTGSVIHSSKTSGSYGIINIYALSKPLILVTYYCNYPVQSYQMCGLILDWSGNVKGNVITFSESCSASEIVKSYKEEGFLYTCYNSTTNTLKWAPYILNSDQSFSTNSSGQTTEITQITNMTLFSKFINIFPTEDGGYGLVYTHYTSIIGQGISSPWVLYYMGISNKDSSSKTPFQIYHSQPNTNTTDYKLYQCSVAQESVGYNCLLYNNRTDKSVYININFWTSSFFSNQTELTVNLPAPYTNVIDIEALAYGGYIFVAKDTSSTTGVGNYKGYIYYNNGTYVGDWGLPVITSDQPIVGVSPDNTVWAINGSSSSSNVTMVSSDTLTNFRPGGALGSSYIQSVIPAANSTIAPGMSVLYITYTGPVSKSSGYFRIWQVNPSGGDDYLRGKIPASDNRVKVDGANVTISLLPSFTSSGSERFYVTVDDDAMKNQENQNLIGIKKPAWSFNTSPAQDNGTGVAKVIVRLTTEGTTLYVSSSSNDRSTFVRNMSSNIATVLGCDISRISMPILYQYSTSHDNNVGDQIFMGVNFNQGSATERSASSLANDLNETIANKDISAISTGTTSNYLDQSNGAWPIPYLWGKYKFILIGVLIGLAILFLLWFLACRRRYRDDKTRRRRQYATRSFITIFLSTLIVVDLILDIIFICLHGRDEKWILPVSRELSHNEHYKKWWQRHSRTALATTLLSGLDNEALNVSSSHTGGFRSLNAPYSPEADRRIFYCTAIIVLIEDVPQFIFLIIYQKVTIIPAIVPILALCSCTILIFFRVISIIYLGFFYDRTSIADRDYDEELKDEKDSIEAMDPGGPVPVHNTERVPTGRLIPTEEESQTMSNIPSHHKGALFIGSGSVGKDGKNGKDSPKTSDRGGLGVHAKKTDLAEHEGPLGKFAHRHSNLDLGMDDQDFETREEIIEEDGVPITKIEKIYSPKIEKTNIYEDVYIEGDAHQSQTREGSSTIQEITHLSHHQLPPDFPPGSRTQTTTYVDEEGITRTRTEYIYPQGQFSESHLPDLPQGSRTNTTTYVDEEGVTRTRTEYLYPEIRLSESQLRELPPDTRTHTTTYVDEEGVTRTRTEYIYPEIRLPESQLRGLPPGTRTHTTTYVDEEGVTRTRTEYIYPETETITTVHGDAPDISTTEIHPSHISR
ncbi:11673_t:CDS:10, partial [Scutellospora calospora]